MKRLAIITTHPIQYYAPVFQLLHQRQVLSIKVFYTVGSFTLKQHDHGFGKAIEWDLPLLNEYPYEWVKNTATDPGSHHREGIVNPGIIGQINNWQPDAVLVFGWAYVSHLQVMRYFKNKAPVFFRGDSTLLDKQSALRSALKTVYLKWMYRHINHAFYTGTNNKAYFKKYGLKNHQLTFAPHAIDNTRFAANRTEEALQLKKELGISPDDVLILFAGKLEEKKSPALLLKAFLTLKKASAHLLFVGNGLLEQQLRATSAGYNNIHFMDFQNQLNMPVVYQACDIFCLPSKGPAETWGLAVNEAMACGKAILVSDKVGCAVDLVVSGINGEIFIAGSATDLNNKLTTLVNKGKNGLAVIGHASKTIITKWSFEQQVNAIENTVLKLS